MGLLDALLAGVRERAQRTDLSRWQKSRDMLELQLYLRNAGRPHSTRELASLTGVSQSTVTGQLQIAAAITDADLTKLGISPDELAHLAHGDLLRIAKLPAYLRDAPLRQAARQGSAEPPPLGNRRGTVVGVREKRREAAYRRMREEGDFQLTLAQPVTQLTRAEAADHLDDVLPAVANLADLLMKPGRGYYIGLTGNGGILVYLQPK